MKIGILLIIILFSIPNLLLAQVNNSKIKIGVTTPLSGDLSYVGDDIKNAFIFANKELLNNKFKLIFKDSACNKKNAISIAHQLINIHKVKYVVGLLCNNTLLASAPIYSKAKVTVLATGATSGDIRDIGKGIFRPYPADHEAIRVIFPYLIENNYRKLGLITEIDEYTELMEKHLIAENQKIEPKKRIKLFIEKVLPNTNDFKSILFKLKRKNLDGIFLNPRSVTSYIKMFKQSRELKLNVQIFANLFPDVNIAKNAIGESDEKVIYTTIKEDANNKIENYNKFVNSNGKPNENPIFSKIAIDSLLVLNNAIEANNNVTDYLYKLDYIGSAGRIKFNKYGEGIGIKYILRALDKN